MTKPFHVLVATDGSAAAKAAITTALSFPWPGGAVASGVVANQLRADTPVPLLSSELDKTAEVLAAAPDCVADVVAVQVIDVPFSGKASVIVPA